MLLSGYLVVVRNMVVVRSRFVVKLSGGVRLKLVVVKYGRMNVMCKAEACKRKPVEKRVELSEEAKECNLSQTKSNNERGLKRGKVVGSEMVVVVFWVGGMQRKLRIGMKWLCCVR